MAALKVLSNRMIRVLRYVLEAETVLNMTEFEFDEHMDCRSKKVFDFVSVSRNHSENVKKEKYRRLRWHRDYWHLREKYVELGKTLNDLFSEENSFDTENIAGRKDKRTCLPFPETTSQNYGWLSRKPDFQLETYGSYIAKYPNPMNEITLLKGDIPTLAPGKGFL